MEYTAAALAMRYGEDVERAQIAGLLHDCAKCMENDKLLSACEKYHLPATDVEKRNPYLLHARVGSYLAKKEYKIEDPEILSAILYHTTGRGVLVVLFCVFLWKTQSTDRLSAVRTEMVGNVPRQRMRMMAFTVPPPTVPTMVA